MLPDYYGATSQNSYLQPTFEGMAAHRTSILPNRALVLSDLQLVYKPCRLDKQVRDQLLLGHHDDACCLIVSTLSNKHLHVQQLFFSCIAHNSCRYREQGRSVFLGCHLSFF